MNTNHKSNGEFAKTKIGVHPKWVILGLIVIVIIAVVHNQYKQRIVTPVQPTTQKVEVADPLLKEVKNSPEFRAKVENMAQQDAKLKEKEIAIAQYEKEKAELQSKLDALKINHDTKLKGIEDELSKLRAESLSFQSPSVLKLPQSQ